MYYVYYNDDYYDVGGVGLGTFDTANQATAFIENRIKGNPEERTLEDYTVIKGKQVELQSIKMVDKVSIKDS